MQQQQQPLVNFWIRNDVDNLMVELQAFREQIETVLRVQNGFVSRHAMMITLGWDGHRYTYNQMAQVQFISPNLLVLLDQNNQPIGFLGKKVFLEDVILFVKNKYLSS